MTCCQAKQALISKLKMDAGVVLMIDTYNNHGWQNNVGYL